VQVVKKFGITLEISEADVLFANTRFRSSSRSSGVISRQRPPLYRISFSEGVLYKYEPTIWWSQIRIIQHMNGNRMIGKIISIVINFCILL
jgi:hypothetical protein